MSNTSTVTPYARTSAPGSEVVLGLAALAAACVVGAAAGVVSVAQWLAEETPEDRAALARLKTERRRERLGSRTARAALTETRRAPSRLTTVSLHLHNPESLVRSAEKLGYHLEPQPQPAPQLAEQPLLLLRKPSGERLAIARHPKGRLVVQTAGNRERVQAVLRQHTLDRSTDHLARQGMHVQTATLANGEVQIVAQERDASRHGGAAAIKAQVRTDGTAWVDVDGVRGNRCETIVAALAQAIGGEVAHTTKKEAYYQLPGEPTKVRQQV
jgi:hypothetical protein